MLIAFSLLVFVYQARNSCCFQIGDARFQDASGMNFSVNIFDFNCGITIWIDWLGCAILN